MQRSLTLIALLSLIESYLLSERAIRAIITASSLLTLLRSSPLSYHIAYHRTHIISIIAQSQHRINVHYWILYIIAQNTDIIGHSHSIIIIKLAITESITIALSLSDTVTIITESTTPLSLIISYHYRRAILISVIMFGATAQRSPVSVAAVANYHIHYY